MQGMIHQCMQAIIDIKNNHIDYEFPLSTLNTLAGATSSTFNSNQ
jgi:hypothetical protein